MLSCLLKTCLEHSYGMLLYKSRLLEAYMKKPIFQGQIDVFCAAYAVINSLRIAQEITLIEAREFFHTALLDIIKDPKIFKKILEQKTDYVFWVDKLLQQEQQKGSLYIEKVFPNASKRLDDGITSDEVWTSIKTWLSEGNKRSCLFQFIRCIPKKQLFVQHWTCGYRMLNNNSTLLFFDSSLDPTSLQQLDKEKLITVFDKKLNENVILKPYTLRLIQPG